MAEILSPYIRPGDHVLDMLCGFSPVAKTMIDRGCTMEGFDKSEEAIIYCHRSYPQGRYTVARDEDLVLPDRVDFLVHLGIAPVVALEDWVSATEQGTSLQVILKRQPRIVVLEGATHWLQGYEKFKRTVESLHDYRLREETPYAFTVGPHSRSSYGERALNRVIAIFERVDEPRENGGEAAALSDEGYAQLWRDTGGAGAGLGDAQRSVGLGFFCYGLGRTLRPGITVVLGANMGFEAIALALAMRDNREAGKLTLVVETGWDAGESSDGGGKLWRDPAGVAQLLARYEVAGIVEVVVMGPENFAQDWQVKKRPGIDLMMIGGDPSYAGFKSRFESYVELVSDSGLMLAHNTAVPNGFQGKAFGVTDYFNEAVIPDDRYEAVTLPTWPGYGLVRKGIKRASAAGAEPASFKLWLKLGYRMLPISSNGRERIRRLLGR